jgi:hypothetical protein
LPLAKIKVWLGPALAANNPSELPFSVLRNFVAVTRWRLVCIFAFGKNYCPAGTLPGRQPAPGRLDLFFRVSTGHTKKENTTLWVVFLFW